MPGKKLGKSAAAKAAASRPAMRRVLVGGPKPISATAHLRQRAKNVTEVFGIDVINEMASERRESENDTQSPSRQPRPNRAQALNASMGSVVRRRPR